LGTIELSLLDDEEIYEDEDFYNGEYYNEYASYHPPLSSSLDGTSCHYENYHAVPSSVGSGGGVAAGADDSGGVGGSVSRVAGHPSLRLSKEEMNDHGSFASSDDLGEMYSSHYIFYSCANETTATKRTKSTESAHVGNENGIEVENLNDKQRVVVGEGQEDSLSSLGDSASLTIPDINSKKSGIVENDHGTTSGATMGDIDEEGEEEEEEAEDEVKKIKLLWIRRRWMKKEVIMKQRIMM